MIKRALQNTGWLMGARGINGVLSLGYLALATRALGVADFGQFILAVTFANALAGISQFQTWQTVVRWGQSKETLPDATGFALALDALTIVGGIIIGGLILLFAGDWLPLPGWLRLETFAYTCVALMCIRSTPTGILRLHDKFANAAVADAVTSIVRIIGAGLAFLFARTIEGFLLAWAVAEIVTAATYWHFARQTQPLFLRHISLRRIPRREKKAWGFVIGTSLSGMLSISSRQVLVLLIGGLGGPALAGIYRVAAQLGEGLLKLAQALLRATYPELVKSPDVAKSIAKRIALIAVATGFVTVILSLVAGRWVISLIAGPEFITAYTPMILLSAAAAIELAGASLEALMVARGRAVTNFLLRAAPTACALGALVWLVDIHGPAGAGMAVLGASVATVTGLFIATRKDTGASAADTPAAGKT